MSESGYYLTGTAFSEDIFGSFGDDDIYGADGDDYIHGGSGNDVLDGGEGDDVLYGGSGNDLLWAGYGADDLIGGTGSDIFAIYAGGAFIIQDFNTFYDALYFNPETTGIYNMDDLCNTISDIEEYDQGVVIDFYQGISITLVGIDYNELGWVSVEFD